MEKESKIKTYTFHFEVEDVLQQFAAALNDIIVRRYNDNRQLGDQIHVNFVYAPKTRTLNEIVNKSQQTKMPCIAISLGGIRRNVNRVFNKIDGSWWRDTLSRSPSSAEWVNLLQPVPIDITVNVSIFARFQSDVDQIVANFVPYTDPYFVISWKWPDLIPFSNFEIRSHVKWSESINFQYPMDFGDTVPYWTNADTSFTIESWMFKNQPPTGQPVYTINNAFIAISGVNEPGIMQSFENIFNTEQVTVSARPQLSLVEPFYGYLGSLTTPYEKQFNIIGKMLDETNAVYLSSNNWNMFNYSTTGDFVTSGPGTIDLFSVSSFAVSASYPSFSGIELLHTNWTSTDANNLRITFTPLQTGVFDIVFLNSAGYGVLSHDCIRPTLNPYPMGTSEYNNYIEYQYPCVSGIPIGSI